MDNYRTTVYTVPGNFVWDFKRERVLLTLWKLGECD